MCLIFLLPQVLYSCCQGSPKEYRFDSIHYRKIL
jgi:hypothetical protein